MRSIYVPTARHGTIELRLVNGLTDIQTAVRGTFENVSLARPQMNMLVNEEGMVQHLAVNYRATALLWVHRPELAFDVYIHGNVLVVGRVNRAGEYEDIPSEVEDLVLRREQFGIQLIQHDQRKHDLVARGIDDVWDAYAAAIKLMDRYGHYFRVVAA